MFGVVPVIIFMFGVCLCMCVCGVGEVLGVYFIVGSWHVKMS